MAPKLTQTADVWILSLVLVYSASDSSTSVSQILLPVLAALALLIDAFYLHAPYPLLSTAAALVALLVPIYPDRTNSIFYDLSIYIVRTPWFVTEMTIGIMLLGNFIRFAIFRPIRQHAMARQSVTPIAMEATPPSEYRAQNETADPPPQGQQQHQPIPPSPSKPADEPEEQIASSSNTPPVAASVEASRAAAMRVLAQTKVRKSEAGSSASHARNTSADAYSAGKSTASSSKSSYVKPVRRRELTSSQILATKIMLQKKEDGRVQEEANQSTQVEVQAPVENQMTKKSALQAQVEEASEGVTRARKALAEARTIADKSREARKRAGDEHLLHPTPENEGLLDEACTDSARKEQIEQSALNDMNAAQAVLQDLRNQLGRMLRK